MNATQSKIEISSDSDLGAFLETELGLLIQPKTDQWKRRIQKQSPTLAPYLITEIQNEISDENVYIFLNYRDFRVSSRKSLQVSWDLVLKEVGSIVTIICAAGGSKAFMDLLKSWVEKSRSRKIKIKKGDIELEIQGGISEKKLKETIELFEESFGESKILIP